MNHSLYFVQREGAGTRDMDIKGLGRLSAPLEPGETLAQFGTPHYPMEITQRGN